jgi:hypothetical protein
VNKCYVVVARDDIAQCRETLFDTLNNNVIRKRVADVQQFLIGSDVGKQETFSVAWSVTTIHAYDDQSTMTMTMTRFGS